MNQNQLLLILTDKATDGKGILSIEKTNSSKIRVKINYQFTISPIGENGFYFHGYTNERILSVINCKVCNTVIL